MWKANGGGAEESPFDLQEVDELLRREFPVGRVAICGGEERGCVTAEVGNHMGVVCDDTEEPFQTPRLRGHNVIDNALHAVLFHGNGVFTNDES